MNGPVRSTLAEKNFTVTVMAGSRSAKQLSQTAAAQSPSMVAR
jgi:hypothetical protein